ncbi:MAG: hypothetical protein GWP06_08245 [Actinobacteria bacterium]|nr:hypothetical protein [Actinomycetota bacterium]
MTDCYKFEKRLSDFLEESLSTNEKESFERHLGKCAKCRKKSEQVQVLRNTLSALPRHKTSPSFDTVLRSNIRREIINNGSVFRFPKINFVWQLPVFAAAAILFIAVGILIDQAFIRNNQLSPIASANKIILEPQTSRTLDTPSPHKTFQESLKITNYVMDRSRSRSLERRDRKRGYNQSLQVKGNTDFHPNDARSFPSQTNFRATTASVRF